MLYAVALNLITQPNFKIASCALIENAVLQVLNLPGYSSCGPVGFEAVRAQLAQLCEDLDHEFWPCDITLKDDSKSNEAGSWVTTRSPMFICWQRRLSIAAHLPPWITGLRCLLFEARKQSI